MLVFFVASRAWRETFFDVFICFCICILYILHIDVHSSGFFFIYGIGLPESPPTGASRDAFCFLYPLFILPGVLNPILSSAISTLFAFFTQDYKAASEYRLQSSSMKRYEVFL